MIAKAAIDIFRDAIDKMVDHSCDAKTEESMRREILKVPGVRRVDLLRTRLFGSKMYVDIEIAAAGEISLNDAHDIAENVHHTIEDKFKDVKHCMVHVNPHQWIKKQAGRNDNDKVVPAACSLHRETPGRGATGCFEGSINN